jgi:amino acid transporter
MAVHKALPAKFANIHRRFLVPTVSTVAMAAVSIVLYVVMNYISAGTVISDSVTALGVLIAFYYGLTGLSCFWYYRRTLSESARHLFVRGLLPLLGWAIMWSIGGYSLAQDWSPANSSTSWRVPGLYWHVGGAFLLAAGPLLVGVVLMFVYQSISPAFFRGDVLNASTATLVPEDLGAPVGLFGVYEQDGRVLDEEAEPV